MEIDATGGQDHDDPAAEPSPQRSRVRHLPGVAAALFKPLHGQALAHWGGTAPPRNEPVDVTGTGSPGRLPAT
ncbi:hypothetical protein [Nocardiopsis alba]|uniref:hypothetical protein n=1 Tax=Nocardiopsis alba TaxID=53437 RepID=UPI00363CD965